MARRTRRKPQRIRVPTVPSAAAWIESDSYDRRRWHEFATASPSSARLAESADRLIPHFDALLQDLFAGLFKLNLLWMEPDRVRRAAIFNRTILERLTASPAFQALRARTVLEEEKAALAALELGRQVLEVLRTERLINRSEMLDLGELSRQEQELETGAAALENAQETAEAIESDEQTDEKVKASVERLVEAAQRAVRVSEARLKQKVRSFESQLEHGDLTELARMELRSAELAGEIDRAWQDSHDFSREFSQGGRLPAAERLELGRRLARNPKLGELARMVGRFKQEARSLKRRTLETAAAEAYDVERGSDLGRLIPAELLALHHPTLKGDFFRRLLEASVLQYRLRDEGQRTRGPMVVCIDVSSSMQGDKEMWSKAVGLTLMDIARRKRRLFRAVMFSAGEDNLKVIDLNRRQHYQPDLKKVLDMAEYFAGGGTEFERPIDRAVELISAKALKRADLVIITDGECQVSEGWLGRLEESKRKLEFSIFGVLCDVGSSRLSSLERFCDHVTSLKRLNERGARDIFLKLSS